MRRVGLILCVMLGVVGMRGTAEAQTQMREDVFDIQTALHFYGFIPGPVDGEVGPSTERGLNALGSYLRLGPIGPEAMDVTPLPLPLRTIMNAYAARNDVDSADLDQRDLARLNNEGERFWVRKELQPDPATWGVEVDAANDTCAAYANESLIGEVIDPDKLPEIDGPGSVRVVYFGPVTMDFRPDRLNLFIDPWNMVTNLSCN